MPPVTRRENQKVGGSVPFLRDDAGHVCKPAAQGEVDFYEALPQVYPHMQRFTPRYFGCCRVNIATMLDGLERHLEFSHRNTHTTRVYADGTKTRSAPTQVKRRWTRFFQRRHKKMEQDADGNVR